jgi:hypothetical protein
LRCPRILPHYIFMIAAFALLFLAIAWRVVLGVNHSSDYGWLHNFAPLSAIALCGAAWLPRRFAIALPLVALFASDLLLNAHYHAPLVTGEMAMRYVALAIIAWGGWLLRESKRTPVMLGASVLSSAVFFVLTNSASWLTDPGYEKTLAGWSQSLTTGLPGYPPTITFFKHTVISDLLFTALFLGCVAYARRHGFLPARERLHVPHRA